MEDVTLCMKVSAQKEKKNSLEAEEKLDRSLKTKTLVVSDSTLRLTNQLALNADVT